MDMPTVEPWMDLMLGIVLVIATGGIMGFTWLLTKHSKAQTDEMRRGREFAEEQAALKRKPVLEGWLEQEENKLAHGHIPMLWLVIGNVGQGCAQNVEWWFDVPEETRAQWAKRGVGGANWPASREQAGGQRILRGGDRISLVMSGGRSLYTEDGIGDYEWDKHEDLKRFTLVLRYEGLQEEKGVREERQELDPQMLYRRGGGKLTSPIHRIAYALEKGLKVSAPVYQEHPRRGLPAAHQSKGTERLVEGTLSPDGASTRVTDTLSRYKTGEC